MGWSNLKGWSYTTINTVLDTVKKVLAEALEAVRDYQSSRGGFAKKRTYPKSLLAHESTTESGGPSESMEQGARKKTRRY